MKSINMIHNNLTKISNESRVITVVLVTERLTKRLVEVKTDDCKITGLNVSKVYACVTSLLCFIK